jgi:hypothetical protein
MFLKQIIDIPYKFNDFKNSCIFSEISEGRKGAVLTDYNNNQFPIVRSTTDYKISTQKLKNIHFELINKIKLTIQLRLKENVNFNNALIEIYENKYNKMKFHSDQKLDLEENSFICLFSCYQNIKNENSRKLVVKSKSNSSNQLLNNFEIELENNSIVFFSIDTNSNFLHKIKLKNHEYENIWLGITLRMSKTFIKFNNLNNPYLLNLSKELRFADETERKEFFILRKNENKEIKFNYPDIDYSISSGDFITIK